jgi:hypothetical protein
MYAKAKTSFVIAAVIALLFTIGLAVAAPVVMAQEPVTEEIENQASLDLTDFTGPALAANPTSELLVIDAALEVPANSAEVTLLATSVGPGSELSGWEKRNLTSPISADDNAAPATSVKPCSELSMWERLTFIFPFLAD